MTTATTDALNSLLRGEISATETYNQALEKFSGMAEETDLRQMRDEHREAASTLNHHVQMQGGDPPHGSGWWGAWAKCVEATAKVFGKTAALKALKEGEEHGIKEYQQALGGNELPSECKNLIRDKLLPWCQSHLASLDRLMSAQSRS